MSVEIAIPFGLSIAGQVAVVTSPNAQAMQHVMSLVSTTPGERVMQPDYGVPLAEYVFAPDFAAEGLMIQNDVATQLARWEPTLTLEGATPVGSPEAGVVSLDVDFSMQPGATSAPTQTATVLVGGTTIQDGQVTTS